MWYPLYFHTVVLMLVMTMKSIESHVTDTSFDMVEPGQSIMGKVGSERSVRRNIECSSMYVVSIIIVGQIERISLDYPRS